MPSAHTPRAHGRYPRACPCKRRGRGYLGRGREIPEEGRNAKFYPCATPTRNVPNSSSRMQAAPRFLRRMWPRMASKDPGAKSEPWSSLHPDSVLAASRLDLQELLRPTKWTAQANGVALMHRQTLICPQLPWIHLRQPCERPDLASVRPDLTSAPSRTAFRCSQAPQRSACCGGSVAATEHSRCRSALFTRARSLTRCSFVLRDRRIVQVSKRTGSTICVEKLRFSMT